jgi:hypothetical protein
MPGAGGMTAPSGAKHCQQVAMSVRFAAPHVAHARLFSVCTRTSSVRDTRLVRVASFDQVSGR